MDSSAKIVLICADRLYAKEVIWPLRKFGSVSWYQPNDIPHSLDSSTDLLIVVACPVLFETDIRFDCFKAKRNLVVVSDDELYISLNRLPKDCKVTVRNQLLKNVESLLVY